MLQGCTNGGGHAMPSWASRARGGDRIQGWGGHIRGCPAGVGVSHHLNPLVHSLGKLSWLAFRMQGGKGSELHSIAVKLSHIELQWVCS